MLVLGGYGNFGQYISRHLATLPDTHLLVCGRDLAKADQLIATLDCHESTMATALQLDIHHDLDRVLKLEQPQVVIHTCGPFQNQSPEVANACIRAGCHYIDLADGRDFVHSFPDLDAAAKAKGVTLISGASSVPCLTDALIRHFKANLTGLEEINYGITTAQKTTRGLATTKAIMTYVGRPFSTLVDGQPTDLFGWQGLRQFKFSHLGKRLFGYCDVPDLALFPQSFPELKTIRFYAGLELPFMHRTLWALSWLVRFRLPISLPHLSPALIAIARWFDPLGTDNSGFFMELSTTEKQVIRFELEAFSGDGLWIPCIPSILLCQQLLDGQLSPGARTAGGLISAQEYLAALEPLRIYWNTTGKVENGLNRSVPPIISAKLSP